MDDCPRTDNAVDQSDQELLIFTVSDEELEKAAGITTWAQTYPQTCSSLSRPYIDGTPVPVEEPSTASGHWNSTAKCPLCAKIRHSALQ